jgi:hypothetical protein
MSGLGHYMKAIHDAIISRPTISKLLEECDCERHKSHSRILSLARGDDDDDEDTTDEFDLNDEDQELHLMWEQGLNGRPVDFIQSTCCSRIEYPDFCIEAGDKPPKMLNWKCHTKDGNKKPLCNECGTEIKFGMSECDVLRECSTVIPVKEWKLVPRTKDLDGDITSTQVELSESQHSNVGISRTSEIAAGNMSDTLW